MFWRSGVDPQNDRNHAKPAKTDIRPSKIDVNLSHIAIHRYRLPLPTIRTYILMISSAIPPNIDFGVRTPMTMYRYPISYIGDTRHVLMGMAMVDHVRTSISVDIDRNRSIFGRFWTDFGSRSIDIDHGSTKCSNSASPTPPTYRTSTYMLQTPQNRPKPSQNGPKRPKTAQNRPKSAKTGPGPSRTPLDPPT